MIRKYIKILSKKSNFTCIIIKLQLYLFIFYFFFQIYLKNVSLFERVFKVIFINLFVNMYVASVS